MKKLRTDRLVDRIFYKIIDEPIKNGLYKSYKDISYCKCEKRKFNLILEITKVTRGRPSICDEIEEDA